MIIKQTTKVRQTKAWRTQLQRPMPRVELIFLFPFPSFSFFSKVHQAEPISETGGCHAVTPRGFSSGPRAKEAQNSMVVLTSPPGAYGRFMTDAQDMQQDSIKMAIFPSNLPQRRTYLDSFGKLGSHLANCNMSSCWKFPLGVRKGGWPLRHDRTIHAVKKVSVDSLQTVTVCTLFGGIDPNQLLPKNLKHTMGGTCSKQKIICCVTKVKGSSSSDLTSIASVSYSWVFVRLAFAYQIDAILGDLRVTQ